MNFFGYPLWRTKLKLQSLNNFPFMMPIKKLGLFGLNLFGKKQKTYTEWLNRAIHGTPIFWGGSEGLNSVRKEIIIE